MLREGQARRAAGEDVVIAIVDTHGRPHTLEAIDGIEVVPAQVVPGAEGSGEEIDLAAVLARRPQTALVDDLEHTCAAGGTSRARYQDVEAMQAAGINVVTTLDVGSVGTVRDLVAEVTGAPSATAVPESVLAGADDIQLVDISPVALRQRLRHGNIYPAAEIDSALKTTFDMAHLAALREIALQVVSTRVAPGRRAAGPGQDVLVAVSALPSGEHLIGRGARLSRLIGGSCTVLAVTPPDTDADVDADPGLQHLRDLSTLTGARFLVRASDDISRTIEEVARELVAGHVVMGTPPPPGWLGRFRPTLADRLLTTLPDLHLHILAPASSAMTGPAEAGPATAARSDSAQPPPAPPKRGALRVYLGYARGCGATSAMLDEAHRRASRGADVVVAAVDPHGQPAVRRNLDGMEVLGAQPGRPGADVLDVDAVLARHPQVVCVDDLAGPTVSGESRLEAARRLVAAGIAVIATVDAAAAAPADGLEGGAGSTSAGPGVGDEDVLAAADEIELVDLPPSALIDRLRGGLVVPADDVERCLAGEFALERLTALRERALRLVARYADRQLSAYLQARNADRPWEIRPRVVACVPPYPGMDAILPVAAGHAALLDGEFVIVTVRAHAPSPRETAALAHYAEFGRQLGVELVTLTGSSVGRAVADYARQNQVTEIILGRRKRGRRRRTVLHELLRRAPNADIHVIPVTVTPVPDA
jgi:two-component system sensor histidine kinase KdpD